MIACCHWCIIRMDTYLLLAYSVCTSLVSSRLVCDGFLNVTYASYSTDGHLFIDLRDECGVCQKHYADNEALAPSGHVSMSPFMGPTVN